MAIVIRPATAADAEPIAHVQVASWKSTYRTIVPDTVLDGLTVPEQTIKWNGWLNQPGHLVYVAESGDRIVGFIGGGQIRQPLKRYDAELYAIYLLPEHQRGGIGRSLVQTLANGLLEQTFRSLLVWVLEANPSSAFYQHLGAVEEGRQTITLGDAFLPELAFGWSDLRRLPRSRTQDST